MENSKQWYVVHTKAGQERKLRDLFQRKKWDSFFPYNKIVKTVYGKEKISYKPVIECYVFVCAAAEDIYKIKMTTGVINLVYWLSKPVVVNNDDIYLLRRFYDMHDDIQLQKIKVNPTQPASLSTHFSDTNEVVSFTLPVLGFTLTAQLSKTRVRVITVPGYQTKTKLFSKYAEAR